jgi:hypothetical protein
MNETWKTLKTTELRSLARDLGIKGMSSANKATLIPAIETVYAEIEAAAKAAKAPKAPKGKRCEICGVRPIGKVARGDSFDYCDACYEEANWENTHSDSGHDEVPTIEEIEDPNAEWTDETDKANALAVRAEMVNCWICHPELNKASTSYVAKRGTSRLGQVMHVTLRASATEKAAQTIAQLPESWTASVKTVKGITTLTAASANESATMVWDSRGRTTGGTYTDLGKTRKIRNVAELLRLAS